MPSKEKKTWNYCKLSQPGLIDMIIWKKKLFIENIHKDFFSSETKNEILSDTKVILTYTKVEIISKKQG